MEVAKQRAARLLWAKPWPSTSRPSTHAAFRRCARIHPDQRLEPRRRRMCSTTSPAPPSQAMAAVAGQTQSLHHQPAGQLALPTDFLGGLHAQHPALPASSKAARRGHRSVGRQLVSLERLDPPIWRCARSAHIAEVEAMGGMVAAIAEGLPKRRIEEAAKGELQGRIDASEQVVVGVNRYQTESADTVELLAVDNSAVLASQLEKLTRLRAERDPAAVERALAALEAGARGKSNLLALSVEAARAKATVGEISLALEKAFGRHQARTEVVRGVYVAAEACGASRAWRGPRPRSPPSPRPTGGLLPRSWSPRWARTSRLPPEGDRHRLRRPRLCRRRRAPLRHPGGDRARGGGARRARGRREFAGRRPPHPDPRTQGRTRTAGAQRYHDRRRRGDPPSPTSRLSSGWRAPDLPTRHPARLVADAAAAILEELQPATSATRRARLIRRGRWPTPAPEAVAPRYRPSSKRSASCCFSRQALFDPWLCFARWIP